MLLLRIHGETIKFSTKLEKDTFNMEKQLVSDINSLESSDIILNHEDLKQKKRTHANKTN
jgi:hypothetical protein